MPKSTERLSAHVGADIPLEMRAALDAEARRYGVSASVVLRWALTAYLPGLQNGPVAPTEKAS